MLMMAHGEAETTPDGRNDHGYHPRDSANKGHLARSAHAVVDAHHVPKVYPEMDVCSYTKVFLPVLGTYPCLPHCIPMDVDYAKHVRSLVIGGKEERLYVGCVGGRPGGCLSPDGKGERLERSLDRGR